MVDIKKMLKNEKIHEEEDEKEFYLVQEVCDSSEIDNEYSDVNVSVRKKEDKFAHYSYQQEMCNIYE